MTSQMLCVYCRAENPPSTNYCRNCRRNFNNSREYLKYFHRRFMKSILSGIIGITLCPITLFHFEKFADAIYIIINTGSERLERPPEVEEGWRGTAIDYGKGK